MSRGKKVFLLSLVTLIALIAVGQVEPPRRSRAARRPARCSRLPHRNRAVTKVPLSQAGHQQAGQRDRAPADLDQLHLDADDRLPRAVHAGRVRVPRHRAHPSEERRPHDDDEHRRRSRSRCSRITRSASRSSSAASRPIANLGGAGAADRHLRPRQRGRHRHCTASSCRAGGTLRRRRDGVVPVPGRVHGDGRLHHHRRDRRADLVRRLPPRRDRDGRGHLPDLRHVGVGRRLARAPRARRCTSGTARSTSPARASSTPPAAGRRSRWR